MTNTRPSRRPQPGYGFASALVLGLALVVTGAFSPGRLDVALSAQALNPCALLTADDVESHVAESDVADGVSNTFPDIGYATCRYAWGVGTGSFSVVVAVTEASRMFPGMSPDQIKQQLAASVRPETDDALLLDIGEAAVFRPESAFYATATSFVKGRVLQVHLDGVFAGEKKDQATELLKSAVSRL